MKQLKLIVVAIVAALISGCSVGTNEAALALHSKLVSAGKLQIVASGGLSVSNILPSATTTTETQSVTASTEVTETPLLHPDPVIDAKEPITAGPDPVIDTKEPITAGPDPVIDTKEPITAGPDPVIDSNDNNNDVAIITTDPVIDDAQPATTSTTTASGQTQDSGATYFITFSDSTFSVESNGTQIATGNWVAISGNTLLVVVNNVENSLDVEIGNETITIGTHTDSTGSSSNSNSQRKCTWQQYPKTRQNPNPVGGTFVCK